MLSRRDFLVSLASGAVSCGSLFAGVDFDCLHDEYIDRLKMELELMKATDSAPLLSAFMNLKKDAETNGVCSIFPYSKVNSSLIAYLSGITSVDPVKYGLMAEDFFFPKRPAFTMAGKANVENICEYRDSGLLHDTKWFYQYGGEEIMVYPERLLDKITEYDDGYSIGDRDTWNFISGGNLRGVGAASQSDIDTWNFIPNGNLKDLSSNYRCEPGINATLIRPESFEELAVVLIISTSNFFWKGIKQARSYIRRHLGYEPVTFPHPALEEMLSPTYGIFIFEEQHNRSVQALVGYSFEEAYKFRRTVIGRFPERIHDARNRFIKSAKERGISDAIQIYESLKDSAELVRPKFFFMPMAMLAHRYAYCRMKGFLS